MEYQQELEEQILETKLLELEKTDFLPTAWMLEYRARHLASDLTMKISQFLNKDLSHQLEWLQGSSMHALVQRDSITEEDLQEWKQPKLDRTEVRLTSARRMAVDRFIKASFHKHFCVESVATAPQQIKDLSHCLFIRRFEAYADYYPDQIALRFWDQSLTYAQVNQQANQFAELLIARGIQKGNLVGTLLRRSPEWIIAILAIWKAGAAFVAIDPTVPAGSFKVRAQYLEKFNQLVNEANLSCVLTDSHCASRISSHLAICIDSIPLEKAANPQVSIFPKDLAYVIYTSGSTGKPKGVLTAHRGLTACLEAHRECVDLTQDTVMAQYASPGFDAWIAEMLILGIGGTLSIIPDEIRFDSERIKAYSHDHQISSVIFTPQLLNQLGGPQDFLSWRALFIVGEKFGWALANHWMTDQLQVVNGYGLTETTICTTLENLNVLREFLMKSYVKLNQEHMPHYLPIGRPILGTKIRLFTPEESDDKKYRPTIEGEHGEIFISGISLTQGYCNEAADKNIERFSLLEGERYYKTGDKAVCCGTDRYIVTGRYNRVFKFSGKLIHLDGLENILLKYAQIKQEGAACLAEENLGEDSKLIIFCQPKDPDNIPSKEAIREHLQSWNIRTVGIPFVLIWKTDKFEKTSNGKKDYQQLMREYSSMLNSDSSPLDTPLNLVSHLDSLMNQIRVLWLNVLTSRSQIKNDQTFFELGGSSVSLMFLLQKLRIEFSINADTLTSSLLLEADTIKQQAVLIHQLTHPMATILLSHNAETPIVQTIYGIPSMLGRADWDYQVMANQISAKYSGMQFISFVGRDPSIMPESIESLATDYTLSILHHRQDRPGPIFVMGWSSGGTIALEVMKQLQKRGLQTFAYVIDTIAPTIYQQLSANILSRELKKLIELIAKQCNLKLNVELESILQQPSMIEKIECVFQVLADAANESSEEIQRMIQVARKIRLSEQVYVPTHVPKFTLYKAQCQLLDNIFKSNEYLNWPATSVDLVADVNQRDHFSLLTDVSFQEIFIYRLKMDYRTYKFSQLRKKIDQEKTIIVPNIHLLPLNSTDQVREPLPLISLSQGLVDFLWNPVKRVLLIQGESGIGKTTVTALIDNHLSSLKVKTKRLLLNKFTCEALKHGIRDEIHDWEDQCPEVRVLILDGYDERNGNIDYNYYETNELSRYENLKVIITCRSESLRSDYHANFIPSNHKAYLEWKLQGFTESQIKDMISLQSEVDKSRAENCFALIQEHPELQEIVKNPLMLTYVLNCLSNLRKITGKMTRYLIYQTVNENYFKRDSEKRANSDSGKTRNPNRIYELTVITHTLALLFFKEGITAKNYKSPIKSYDLLLGEMNDPITDWDRCLDTTDEKGSVDPIKEQKISACPISREGDIVTFIHASELEFFIVEALIAALSSKLTNMKIAERFMNFEITPAKLVSNDSIVRFWREGFQHHPGLESRLFDILHETKEQERLAVLGGIAITLLNMAFVNFCNKDFTAVRIPGAILDGALMDRVNFTCANLNGVSFKQAWLHNGRFEKANLANIHFGEYAEINHRDSVTSVSFSTDGNILAFANSGSSITLTNTTSYEEIGSLRIMDMGLANIQEIMFLPQSHQLISRGTDSLCLWDVDSRRCVSVFVLDDYFDISNFSVNNNGNYIVLGCNQDFLMIFEIKSDTVSAFDWESSHDECHQCMNHSTKSTEPSPVIFSPDGLLLAQGYYEVIMLHDFVKKNHLATLRGHEKFISSIAFSSGRNRLFSGSHDKTIRIWDLTENICEGVLRGHENSLIELIHAGKRDLLLSQDQESIRIWNVINKSCLRVLRGHSALMTFIALSPNEELFLSGGYDNKICLYDLSENMNQSLQKDYPMNLRDCAFTHDSSLLISLDGDKMLRIKSVLENSILAMIKTDFRLIKVSGARVATYDGNVVKIWRLNQEFSSTFSVLNLIHSFKKQGYISSLELSHDGKLLAIGGYGQSIEIYEIDSEKLVCFSDKKWEQISDRIYDTWNSCSSFSKLEPLLATADFPSEWTGDVRIWSLASESWVMNIGRFTDPVSCLTFCQEGGSLLAIGYAHNIDLWELNSLKLVDRLYLTAKPLGIFYSSKSQLIVALEEGDIQTWQYTNHEWSMKVTFASRSPRLSLQGASYGDSVDLSFRNRVLFDQKGGHESHRSNDTIDCLQIASRNPHAFFNSPRQDNSSIRENVKRFEK